MVTPKEEANILNLRKRNLELARKKLQVLYLAEYGEHISTWRIERVIQKIQSLSGLSKTQLPGAEKTQFHA